MIQRFAQIFRTLPQFFEQPRVFNGNDRLGGEVLHQLDLLVGERTYLLAVNNNCANQFVFLEHRHCNKGPSACELDGNDAQRLPLSVSGISLEVRDMSDLLCACKPTNACVLAWTYRSVLLPVLAAGWCYLVSMCREKPFTVVEQKLAELGFANAHCV